MKHWESPYAENQNWYKGAIHVHTMNSTCGKYHPEIVVDAYGGKSHKYDYMVITDHDSCTNMEEYQGKHGLVIIPGVEESIGMSHIVAVNSKIPRRLSPEKYETVMSELEREMGLILDKETLTQIGIEKNKLKAWDDNNLHWMLERLLKASRKFLNEEVVDSLYDRVKNIMGEADYQLIIDSVRRDGGLTILAHPHWLRENYWDRGLLLNLENYTGIEIHSGDTVSPLTHVATDTWDMVLSAGKRVWGFGGDDFHDMGEFAKVWNVVNAKEKTAEAIVSSLKRGNFYVSTGVELSFIKAENDRIIIKLKDDCFSDRFEKTFRFIGIHGKAMQTQTGKNPAAVYQARGDEDYVRVHIIMENGSMAYTQPFFLKTRNT